MRERDEEIDWEKEVKDHRSVGGSKGDEMGGWVWQRWDRQVGLIAARSVGGFEGGDNNEIGL